MYRYGVPARTTPYGQVSSDPHMDALLNYDAMNYIPFVRGGSSSEANNMNEEVSQQNIPSPVIPATVGGEDRRILITPVGTNHPFGSRIQIFWQPPKGTKRTVWEKKKGKGHSVHICGPHPLHEHTRLLTSYEKRRLELMKSRPSGSTISPAEDLEILTDLVGLSQRTKLPRVVDVAATLTPGTR
ncbi:hypothetical protein QQ045_019887 [Rhodiola kirilowii]